MDAKEIKNQFLMTVDSYIQRDGIDDLIKWLENETDFFTAPASTKFHSCFEGGLAWHSLIVMEELEKEIRREFGDAYADEHMEAIAIIGLLHDICKVNTYHKDWKNSKLFSPAGKKNDIYDERGPYDWQATPFFMFEEAMPMGHSQKSVILIQRHIKLTDDEIYSILGHMGGFDISARAGDYLVSNIFANCPLAALTNIADMKATYFREEGSSKYGPLKKA